MATPVALMFQLANYAVEHKWTEEQIDKAEGWLEHHAFKTTSELVGFLRYMESSQTEEPQVLLPTKIIPMTSGVGPWQGKDVFAHVEVTQPEPDKLVGTFEIKGSDAEMFLQMWDLTQFSFYFHPANPGMTLKKEN